MNCDCSLRFHTGMVRVIVIHRAVLTRLLTPIAWSVDDSLCIVYLTTLLTLTFCCYAIYTKCECNCLISIGKYIFDQKQFEGEWKLTSDVFAATQLLFVLYN